MKPIRLCLVLFVAMLLAAAGCKHASSGESAGKSEATPAAPPQQLYTAHNIWYQKPGAILAINPQTGTIIPAGTPVARYSVKGNRIVFEAGGSGKFTMQFNSKHFGGKGAGEIAQRMFTEQTLSERTANMSASSIENIRQGTIGKGMSKAAVLISLGFPPEIRTPSTDQNTWIYWVNRFKTMTVTFDSDGRVSEVKR